MEEIEQSSGPTKRPRRRRSQFLDLNSKDAAGNGEGPEDDDQDGGGYNGDPEIGMVFKTPQEASLFYKRYARRVGFATSVRRSFFKDGVCRHLDLMCCKGARNHPKPKFRKRTFAATDCPARIRLKLWSDGLLHLVQVVLDHNHAISPSMARLLGLYRGISKRRNEVPAVSPPGALEELLFGESEPRGLVERGRLKLGEGGAEALRLFFTKMQAKNSNFFGVVDLDEEGRARSAFWADARSRAAFRYFDDVVALDTSCVTNKYDVPLVTFVGVNHHGQQVLLGCGLLSDETAETYTWLFKAWIACMSGNRPKALITGHCDGIESAVAEVLPGVRHRLCLLQVMKKVPEKLGGLAEYRAISKALQKVVYDSLRPDEFEEHWRGMIYMYGLHDNEWLRSLYERRRYWVPAFLKDAFWAGMSTTQPSETTSSFFDGYVDANTSLKEFMSKYEMALKSKYDREMQSDFEAFHRRRPAVSEFYMEEQLSKVYTLNIFKKFQDEIEAILYCHPSVLTVDGPNSTFDVRERIFLEDGKTTMTRCYRVLYNEEEKDVECNCGSFQFRGILCRHALSVFKMKQVHEIPSKYILDRWKKGFKRLHLVAHSAGDVVANNRVDRYDYLSTRCLQLVEIGMVSDKYQLALKLIREAEKFLLSDGTYEDTIPKIVSRVRKANKPDRNCNQNVGKTLPSENCSRDRLPQGKESQQDSLGSSKAAVHPNALPPGSHFPVPTNHQQYMGSQVADQSVILTVHYIRTNEAMNPNALPPDSQFPVPMNHQQGNQAAHRSIAPAPAVHYIRPHGPVNANALPPPGSHFAVPVSHQQYMGNQAANRSIVPSAHYIRTHDAVNPNDLPPGSHFAVPMHHQQYMGNQTRGFDSQPFGNAPMMPWVYPQMFQGAQQLASGQAAGQAVKKLASGQAAGQAVKKRKRISVPKPVQAAEEPQAAPAPAAPPTSAASPGPAAPPGSAASPCPIVPPGSAAPPDSTTPSGPTASYRRKGKLLSSSAF